MVMKPGVIVLRARLDVRAQLATNVTRGIVSSREPGPRRNGHLVWTSFLPPGSLNVSVGFSTDLHGFVGGTC